MDYKKSTVKIKFASGHRNRPLQEEHCKKIKQICLQVNEIDLHKKSTVKSKFASRSTKSTFIRRALQKLNLPQGHENRPLHEEHPQRGRNKIERRARKLKDKRPSNITTNQNLIS